MDMSDLQLPSSTPPSPASGEAGPDGVASWVELLGQVGAEIAGPLNTAIERVAALATTGQIDRQSLRSLRDELEQARRVGMLGQQLARFGSQRVRQSQERVQLTQMLRDVLIQRAPEMQALGIQFKQLLQPVEVMADPSLLFTLLNALVEWALSSAHSPVELRIDTRPWPAHGRLGCRFAHRLPDEAGGGNAAADATHAHSLDTLTWRLLEQVVATMGLAMERTDDTTSVTLLIEFPRTVNERIEGVCTVELDQGFSPSTHAKPLAGSHVLVLASRRDVRSHVRDAIRHMGLIIDFVSSVEEAGQFCADGLPHAIVFESALRGDRLDALRGQILEQAPDFVFIEIAEEGRDFEVSGFSGTGMARVGRDAILSSLPSALLFELSRGV